MKKHYDIIIVGGGAVGASALYALAEAGVTRTLLLEKQKQYARGSTGAWGSLVRIYHKNPVVTALASQSVQYYLNFKDRTGYDSGLTQSGSLYFLKLSQLEETKDKIRVIHEEGPLRLEILTAAEGKQRFPTFQWMADDFAIYEDYAGHACPWATTEAWINAAVQKGATAQTDCKVLEFLFEQNKLIGVKTSQGESIYGDKIVLASGAWTPSLLSGIEPSVKIIPRAIQVSHFHRENKKAHEPFFIDSENRSFGRPLDDGSFLGGYLVDEPVANPDKQQTVSLKEAQEAKRRLSQRLHWIKNATLVGGTRAVEGYTEDLNGLLRYSSQYPNLLIAAGWSCCGFTLAPVIGKRISKLLNARPAEEVFHASL